MNKKRSSMSGPTRHVIAFDAPTSRMLDELAEWWHRDHLYAVERAIKDVYYEHKRMRERDMKKRLTGEARRAPALTGLEEELRVAGETRISGRLLNVLVDHGVPSFGALVERYTEKDIANWPQVGAGTIAELKKILRELDLPLRSE